MRENIGTVILGPRVVLVPYQQDHVPKYHEWMMDAELRNLTASEPLTLEEEYDMQQKWQNDEDKLTFIVLARQPADKLPVLTDLSEDILPLSTDDQRVVSLPMIGDVNLFLKGSRPEVSKMLQDSSADEDSDDFEAEVEVMIAEKAYRRRGLALEALRLLLTYVTGRAPAFVPPEDLADSAIQPYFSYIPVTQSPVSLMTIVEPKRLVTRIAETNEPSIRLFENLGFEIVKRVKVFQEVEMRWKGCKCVGGATRSI